MRLAILSARLDRAARATVSLHLSTRVRADGRFAPLLRGLHHLALRG